MRYLNLLHVEHGLYSSTVKQADERYKDIFFRLYKRRDLWFCAKEVEDPEEEERKKELPLWRLEPKPATTENFNIQVSFRLKPKSQEEDEEKEVTLPLHQRIQLIKMSKKLKSNAAALRVLKREGAWFGERKWDEKTAPESGENKENSLENNKQQAETLRGGIHSVDAFSSKVVMVDPTKGLREFEFDSVLPDKSSQGTVYESSARRLVSDFINGFNGTILVYGQTGSGKTHTMFGPDDDAVFGDHSKPATSRQMRGIIPRACAEVLDALEFRSTQLNLKMTASLSVSYVEIYGNQVNDLLNGGAPCGHSKVAAQRFVLDGAAENPITCLADVQRVLRIGEEGKRRAATAMNERSSRAHCLFIISLDQKNLDTGVSCKSRLFLADLGGSEQVKKSKVNVGTSKHIEKLKLQTMGDNGRTLAESGAGAGGGGEEGGENLNTNFSTGFKFSDRLREAVYINTGLLALKQCVKALNDTESKSQYVPYGDSKLTLLLSSGLGGDSKTSVVVCAAQEGKHSSETTAALLFGQACRKITKTAMSGANMLADLIHKIDREIATVEAQIKAKERWEVKEEKRKDDRVEEGTVEALGFGGVEVKKSTVLVGAEAERKRLNELLMERAQLTGTTLESEVGGSQFGGAVGFGTRFGAGFGTSVNNAEEVYRFKDTVDEEAIPDVLKGKVAGWKGAEAAPSKEKLQKFARKANRRKMAYAGISA
ncbi:hypothetical protein TrST_g9268 [Triparma strigata]|uniref:Kinesin motor domain-containing protein n=1 Tax=Triparma strigata TaxID=1606541 RepID=A0A9W7E2J5_9STRA|nr:hypothetical protein TrST_g9268 [Triparma strigata]